MVLNMMGKAAGLLAGLALVAGMAGCRVHVDKGDAGGAGTSPCTASAPPRTKSSVIKV